MFFSDGGQLNCFAFELNKLLRIYPLYCLCLRYTLLDMIADALPVGQSRTAAKNGFIRFIRRVARHNIGVKCEERPKAAPGIFANSRLNHLFHFTAPEKSAKTVVTELPNAAIFCSDA